MYGALGALLLALAVILFAWTFIESRKPEPSSWAIGDFSTQIIIMLVVVLLTFGGGLLGSFVVALGETPPTATEAGLILAVASVSLAALLALRRQWRQVKAMRPTLAAANDPGPAPRPLGTGERRRMRKAA